METFYQAVTLNDDVIAEADARSSLIESVTEYYQDSSDEHGVIDLLIHKVSTEDLEPIETEELLLDYQVPSFDPQKAWG